MDTDVEGRESGELAFIWCFALFEEIGSKIWKELLLSYVSAGISRGCIQAANRESSRGLFVLTL